VANDELLDPVSSPDVSDEESPTWQAIIASVPESAARLTERSHLARQLLVGFLTAGALVLAPRFDRGGGAGSLLPAQPDRGRVGHRDVRLPVAPLRPNGGAPGRFLAATVFIPTGVTIRLCQWYPESAWLVLSIYAAIVLVALILVGATDGVRRMSPVSKRILELLDGAAIAAVIPMLLWIAGVYDILRNLRF